MPRAAPRCGVPAVNASDGGLNMVARAGWMALAVSVLVAVLLVTEVGAQSRVIIDHPSRFAANVGDIGATLTEIVAAPSSNQYIYVTAIILSSSTATAGSFALRAGQGANCATNPVGLFPQPGVS